MKTVTLTTARNVLPDGEIWGFNAFAPHPDRPSTRHFQMHPAEILPEDELTVLQEWKGPGPIYVLSLADIQDLAPNPLAEPYPLDAVEAHLGAGPWCSSYDYMLALAIHEGFERIHISACDLQMGAPRERLMEHVSLAYWVGQATARKIEVTIGGLALHFPHKYGYHFQAERTFGQRMAFWAFLGMCSFKFDDGGATTDIEGWKATFDPRRVGISI